MTMRPRPAKARLLAFLAGALLVLAACGGGTGGGQEQGQGQEHDTVRVGVLPLTAVAPLYIGIDKGFFAEEKLTVEPQSAQGGAAIVPAVVADEFQFGYSNNVSLLLATAKGLPLQIVAEGNQAATNSDDATDAIVAGQDSGIDSVEDLQGKTIGVNTLKNIGEVVIKSALEERDADIAEIKFVEIPFPEMVGAVQSGRIDAGWVVEPFLQQASAADMRVLAHPFFETAERLSIATYFTSDEYAAQNPEVVERFTRAMNRSLEYAQQHPEEVRQITQTYTEIPPDVAQNMRLTYFTPQLNTQSIDRLGDLMVKYGVVDSKPDIGELADPQR